MRLRSLVIGSAALVLLSGNVFAQGPKQLRASASRQWKNYSNVLGFDLALPDFFKASNTATPQMQEFQAANPSNAGILIFISRVGEPSSASLHSRYDQLVTDLRHEEGVSIRSKRLLRSGFIVWSSSHTDDELDSRGKEQVFISYERGISTANGLFEIDIRFWPQYQKTVTAMLPHLLSGFQISKNS